MKFSKTLIFCSIVFCSASLFAAEFPFHAVPYYPAFHATLAIADDFNQDGTPDLVMIDSSGKRLGVMNGDGKGGLTAPKFVDSRIRLGAVATGRLNSDPYPDLAAIGVQDASLVIFLNRGDGTFGPPVEYKLRNLPLGISTGDLNGDLQDDIAIAIQGEPTGFVQVLLGSPTGALQPLKAFPMPSPTSVAIGHFDGDQRLDIAVTSFHENSVAILRGNGNGEFTSLSKARSTTGARQILAGDLDQDERADLVVLNIYNQIGFLHNTGNGHFDAPQTYQLKSPSGNVTITSDPSTPTVIVTDGSTIVSFKRTGSGYSRNNFPFGYNSAIASADWNRDGEADLAVNISDFNSNVAYVAIIRSIRNGFRLSPHFGEAARGSELDFNQDGHLDLIGSDSLFLGNGNGTFQKQTIPGVNTVGYDFPEVVFLNEDPAPDLAIIRPYGQSTFRLNNRHGKFGPDHELAPGIHELNNIFTSDLNHDGHTDYISENSNRFLSWLGKGKGVFENRSELPGSVCYEMAGLFDLDRDGNSDLIDGCGDHLILRYGNGNGTFQQPVNLFFDGLEITSFLAKDWNNDGIAELMVFDYNGVAEYVRGIGRGKFGAPQQYSGLGNATTAVTADFNQDGIEDLAVAGQDSAIALYYGTGDASSDRPFQQPIFFGIGLFFSNLSLGDFNEDGKPDLIDTAQYPGRTIMLIHQR